MRILILGAWCSHNLGDPVICQCVASRLQSRYPGAEIVLRDVMERDRLTPEPVPTRRVLENQWLHEKARRWAAILGWDKVLIRERKRVEQNKAYISSICDEDWDAVVFAGGQMFWDGYALFLEAFTTGFAQKGIPVFFNACGTGPAYSKAIAARLKTALSLKNVCYISCRDGDEQVDRLYLPEGKKAVSTFDPGLWSGEVFAVERDEKSSVLGLGVMYPWGLWPGAALRFWRRLIRLLEKEGISWKLFTNGSGGDIAFCRQILEAFPEYGEDRICPADLHPEGLVRTVSRFSGIISFRLHSHIIAGSLGIPSVAIEWDRKLPAYFEKIGHRERCLRVKARPEEVLAALQLAQTQGVPVQLLRSQAEQSMESLFTAMEAAVPELKEGFL